MAPALQSLCTTLDQELRLKTEQYKWTGNCSLDCYTMTHGDLSPGLEPPESTRYFWNGDHILLEHTSVHSRVTKESERKVTCLATGSVWSFQRQSRVCSPAWRACDCGKPYGLLLTVCQGKRMAGVHVDTVTGQKELFLTSWFNMEDLGYGTEGQSAKSSVEILIPKARVPTRRGT